MCDINKHRVVAWDEIGERSVFEFNTEQEATDKYDSLDIDSDDWYEVHQYAPGEEIETPDSDDLEDFIICGE